MPESTNSKHSFSVKIEMNLIGQSNRTIKTNQESQKQYCGNLGKKKNGKEADD